jgi:hypothetical protein
MFTRALRKARRPSFTEDVPLDPLDQMKVPEQPSAATRTPIKIARKRKRTMLLRLSPCSHPRLRQMMDAILVAAHSRLTAVKEDLKDLSLRESSNEGVGNNIDQETCNIMVLSLQYNLEQKLRWCLSVA